MKKLIFSILVILAVAFAFSCKGLLEDTTDNVKTPQEYWGTWIRMDTGDTIYISSTTNTSGYTLDGDNVMKNGSTVYFRKGGSARDFSMTVSGFSDSRAARTISTGKQGIFGHRQNKENSADTETVTSDSTGKIAFTGAVADDTQKITISTPSSTPETTVTESIEVTPQYNGENLGTIPLVEENTYGFKTTYSIDSDEQGFCFGNYYKTYTLELNINNIGSAICETSVYTVSCNDSKLSISGNTTGNFTSIPAGDSKKVSFDVSYGVLNTEYVDVPINISITDSKYMRTWEDSITLRFYKGLVRLFVGSRNFDKSSTARLNGFLIYPDGRSKRFTVSGGYKKTILVPWSESDYMLSFSGATANNEMAYSFGFKDKTSLAELYDDVWSIEEINAYEPNNSTTTAYNIADLTKPVKSYLKSGDIDFYTINCSTCDSSTSIATDNQSENILGLKLYKAANPYRDGKIYFIYANLSYPQSKYAYIWVNDSYSGVSFNGHPTATTTSAGSASFYASGAGIYSIVLKDGDTSSAIRVSNTLSITIE